MKQWQLRGRRALSYFIIFKGGFYDEENTEKRMGNDRPDDSGYAACICAGNGG